MSDEDAPDGLPDLLALWVHDLRNPVASMSANLSFVRETIEVDDPDAREALEDVDAALSELMRGLDQLAWISRWLEGAGALEAVPGDARAAVQAALRRIDRPITCELPPEPLSVRAGGNALMRLVELLVRNALSFADPASIVVVASAAPPGVIVEVRDGGRALGEDLRERAFTFAGQQDIKGRADGRYSRVTGLVAARALAEALGAELTAGGVDGAAFFRVRLPLA